MTFDGLLWGYEDELPCLKLDHPSGCAAVLGGAGGDGADGFGFGLSDEDEWGDDDWKRRRRRKKREAGEGAAAAAAAEVVKKKFANPDLVRRKICKTAQK